MIMNKYGRIVVNNFNRDEFEMYEKRFYDALEKWAEELETKNG